MAELSLTLLVTNDCERAFCVTVPTAVNTANYVYNQKLLNCAMLLSIYYFEENILPISNIDFKVSLCCLMLWNSFSWPLTSFHTC